MMGDSHLLRKMYILLFVVAKDKMVQPLSFSKNKTKGTESVVSRQLSRPLGGGLVVLVMPMVRGPR